MCARCSVSVINIRTDGGVRTHLSRIRSTEVRVYVVLLIIMFAFTYQQIIEI